MDPVESLFRKGLMEMNSYIPIEPPDQIAQRLGLPEHKIIKLDANENPYGVLGEVLHELGQSKNLNVYPDPAQKAIRNEIADYVGCTAKNIVAGAGADDLIDLICRLILNPGDKALTFAPTFAYYEHIVKLNNGILLNFPRNDDYSIEAKSLSSLDLQGIKLVVLCSPNNPSGNMLEQEVLKLFLEKELLVVVDEAYFEFTGSTQADLITKYDNLLILRTFSKVFGLAGLRVGYGIMSPSLHRAIMKIKPPYSVSMAAKIALKTCLTNKSIFDKQVEQIKATRDRVITALTSCGEHKVYQSHANFILFKLKNKNAKALKDTLESKGILLRHYNSPLLHNHLPVSVGTDRQMDIFLRELFGLLRIN